MKKMLRVLWILCASIMVMSQADAILDLSKVTTAQNLFDAALKYGKDCKNFAPSTFEQDVIQPINGFKKNTTTADHHQAIIAYVMGCLYELNRYEGLKRITHAAQVKLGNSKNFTAFTLATLSQLIEKLTERTISKGTITLNQEMQTAFGTSEPSVSVKEFVALLSMYQELVKSSTIGVFSKDSAKKDDIKKWFENGERTERIARQFNIMELRQIDTAKKEEKRLAEEEKEKRRAEEEAEKQATEAQRRTIAATTIQKAVRSHQAKARLAELRKAKADADQREEERKAEEAAREKTKAQKVKELALKNITSAYNNGTHDAEFSSNKYTTNFQKRIAYIQGCLKIKTENDRKEYKGKNAFSLTLLDGLIQELEQVADKNDTEVALFNTSGEIIEGTHTLNEFVALLKTYRKRLYMAQDKNQSGFFDGNTITYAFDVIKLIELQKTLVIASEYQAEINKETKKKHQAATTIQKIVRGNKARNAFKQLKQDLAKEAVVDLHEEGAEVSEATVAPVNSQITDSTISASAAEAPATTLTTNAAVTATQGAHEEAEVDVADEASKITKTTFTSASEAYEAGKKAADLKEIVVADDPVLSTPPQSATANTNEEAQRKEEKKMTAITAWESTLKKLQQRKQEAQQAQMLQDAAQLKQKRADEAAEEKRKAEELQAAQKAQLQEALTTLRGKLEAVRSKITAEQTGLKARFKQLSRRMVH